MIYEFRPARRVAETPDDWVECWECGGEGEIPNCWEEYACVDPEGGCEECREPCGICHGKCGWPRSGDPFYDDDCQQDDVPPAVEEVSP